MDWAMKERGTRSGGLAFWWGWIRGSTGSIRLDELLNRIRIR